MSDFMHLLPYEPLEVQTFNAISGPGAMAATSPFHVWRKNRGLKFVEFSLLGAGASGGNGFTAAAAAARGGGGGGGSGARACALFLADLLPDELFLWVPSGGTAGVGGRAIVGFNPLSIVAANLLLISGAADAAAGGNGTGAAVGALGAAGTVAAQTTAMWTQLALTFFAQVGSPGVAGGAVAGAVGASKTVDGIVTGGAGGAGTTSADFAGGAITTAGIVPGVPAAASGSNPGFNGLQQDSPHGLFYSTGAGGGSSSNSSVGGKGGDAGIGSGGGGGGGGTTGGTGGKGGDSLILVYSW